MTMSDRPNNYWEVPELDSAQSVVRISPDVNVPMTPRVQRVIDTADFRRLGRISQLGLVSLVYPGATHSRLEHSLGVYRNAIEFLCRLQFDERFIGLVGREEATLFLLSSLLHDIGHWPFCHAIEDMQLPGIPRHEVLAKKLITQGELARTIESDWKLDPQQVASFVAGTLGFARNRNANASESKQDASSEQSGLQLLQSMLSGPIDIDKIDYLERDSLHAGVPYGRNFDRNRLINSLCVDPTQARLALTEKGRTAAEMLVFARYVMFSEVYWHHAVRSATAMLQRAVFAIHQSKRMPSEWASMNEAVMIESLQELSRDQSWIACVDGLFGPHRKLYKRVAQFDSLSGPKIHRALAQKPYSDNVDLAQRIASQLSQRTGRSIGPHDILIDAPPVKLEVQFHVNICLSNRTVIALKDASPVVHALALQQFDDMVKRVRIFVRPDLQESLGKIDFQEFLG